MRTPDTELAKLYRRYDRVVQLIKQYNEQPASQARTEALRLLNAKYSQVCSECHEFFAGMSGQKI